MARQCRTHPLRDLEAPLPSVAPPISEVRLLFLQAADPGMQYLAPNGRNALHFGAEAAGFKTEFSWRCNCNDKQVKVFERLRTVVCIPQT